jgi:hypothetical protein
LWLPTTGSWSQADHHRLRLIVYQHFQVGIRRLIARTVRQWKQPSSSSLRQRFLECVGAKAIVDPRVSVQRVCGAA